MFTVAKSCDTHLPGLPLGGGQEMPMVDTATSIARNARRTALIHTVRGRPELTIAQLERLLSNSEYANELGQITVSELFGEAPKEAAITVQSGESLEEAILRVFHNLPAKQLASGFFCRYMGLQRWTAQKALAQLAEQGLLVRTGKTSGTRYQLPRSRPSSGASRV